MEFPGYDSTKSLRDCSQASRRVGGTGGLIGSEEQALNDFTREVRAPVDLVLEAIRNDAREWRESALPEEIRRRGFTRVNGIVKPPFFRLWLHANGGRNEVPHLIRGVVVEGPDGVTRIRGERGRDAVSPRTILATAAAAVPISWISGDLMAIMIVPIAATVALLVSASQRASRRGAAEDEYLMERLAHALAAAEEKAALASATQPGAIPASRAARPNSPARMPWNRP